MTAPFEKIVGIGGIGTGMLFHTSTQRTLGRSESRTVILSDAKDYCKLHIVFYYAAALLAPRVGVYPVGFVGGDAIGEKLLQEMASAGMNISQVKPIPGRPTTISICLQYPDKETCNFTAQNGACGCLSPETVNASVREIGLDNRTIVAALPEVSVESRLELLRRGREAGAFCVLTVPEAEVDTLGTPEVYAMTDLLSVNEDEARALAKSSAGGAELASQLYGMAAKASAKLRLAVTCGAKGAWLVSEEGLEYVPPFPVPCVVNTTGAGDAFLGGMLAGLALGFPFQKGRNDRLFGDTPLETAAELGTVCAGLAVQTADSIAYSVTRESISPYLPDFRL